MIRKIIRWNRLIKFIKWQRELGVTEFEIKTVDDEMKVQGKNQMFGTIERIKY